MGGYRVGGIEEGRSSGTRFSSIRPIDRQEGRKPEPLNLRISGTRYGMNQPWRPGEPPTEFIRKPSNQAKFARALELAGRMERAIAGRDKNSLLEVFLSLGGVRNIAERRGLQQLAGIFCARNPEELFIRIMQFNPQPLENLELALRTPVERLNKAPSKKPLMKKPPKDPRKPV